MNKSRRNPMVADKVSSEALSVDILADFEAETKWAVNSKMAWYEGTLFVGRNLRPAIADNPTFMKQEAATVWLTDLEFDLGNTKRYVVRQPCITPIDQRHVAIIERIHDRRGGLRAAQRLSS